MLSEVTCTAGVAVAAAPMEACPTYPCPFCTLAVRHVAEQEEIGLALRRSAQETMHNRMTLLQFGMRRLAAAEALHSRCIASSPDEALNLVARMEAEQLHFSDTGALAAPTTTPPERLQPSTSLTPAGSTSGQLCDSTLAGSSSGNSAAASVLHLPTAFVFAPPPPPRVQSGARAASAGSAWLAPASTQEATDGAYVVPQLTNMELALPGSRSLQLMMESGSDSDDCVWQVHAGKTGKLFWKTVDDDLAAILEEAYQNGNLSAKWEYDGWEYHYDMVTMVQTSKTTGAQRSIRRLDGDADDQDD